MERISIFILAVLASSVLLSAQETRREVDHAASAMTSKPNSDSVPEVIAIEGHLQRIVVLRFKYDTDLLAGLENMVKQEKIKNAVILTAVGSVRGFQVHMVGNRDLPVKDVYIKNPSGAADIIGMSGYVINGRLHPHITMATPEKAFGGHLESGTTVYTFAIVTLGVLDDNIDLSKVDDMNYR